MCSLWVPAGCGMRHCFCWCCWQSASERRNSLALSLCSTTTQLFFGCSSFPKSSQNQRGIHSTCRDQYVVHKRRTRHPVHTFLFFESFCFFNFHRVYRMDVVRFRTKKNTVYRSFPFHCLVFLLLPSFYFFIHCLICTYTRGIQRWCTTHMQTHTHAQVPCTSLLCPTNTLVFGALACVPSSSSYFSIYSFFVHFYSWSTRRGVAELDEYFFVKNKKIYEFFS